MQLVFEEGSGEPTAGERVEDENSEIQDARSHLCCMIGILYLSNCSTLVKERSLLSAGTDARWSWSMSMFDTISIGRYCELLQGNFRITDDILRRYHKTLSVNQCVLLSELSLTASDRGSPNVFCNLYSHILHDAVAL